MKKIAFILVCILFCGALIVYASQYIYGDADGDGAITAYDAAAVLQKVLSADFVLPVEDERDDYMQVIDVDNDNVLTSSDSAYILQKVLDADYKMPCENTETITETTTETTTAADLSITVSAGGKSFNAVLNDSAAAKEFWDRLPMTVNMSELNGNEKYYYCNEEYTTDTQTVGYINAGDIMLYGNDCIVLFYESFSTSYRYTPLGSIDNPGGLAQALGSGSVSVTFAK